MNPPANPHQAEFNRAYREAMQAAGFLAQQAHPPSLPAHALALHPWLAKYAATARIETMTITNPHTGHDERGQVVTVTVQQKI